MSFTKKYNPFKYPPSYSICMKHLKASKVGMVSDNTKDPCPCCNQSSRSRPFGKCCNWEEMSFLGSGYPLYFQFLKQSIYLLVIIYIVLGAYFNYQSYFYSKQKECFPYCPEHIQTTLSITNRELKSPD